MRPTSVAQLALVTLASVAVIATGAAATAAAASEYFEGDGTVYTLGEPSNGNCNFMATPDDAVTKYAALNTQQWASTRNCGRCAEVSCADARCAGKATRASEIVHIVDQCPGCAMGDLDLSPSVFKAVTGFESDRIKVKWRFVDCPVRSKIKYCLKKGSNAFWAAIQPTNFVAGVASVQVNGRDTTMVDSAYYFLLDGKSETKVDLSKVTITLMGVNGERVQDTVSFANADCVEGTSQFTTLLPNPAAQTLVPAVVPVILPSVPSGTPSAVQKTTLAPTLTPSVQPAGSLATPPPAPMTQATAVPVAASPAPSTATPRVSSPSESKRNVTTSSLEVGSEEDRGAVSQDDGGISTSASLLKPDTAAAAVSSSEVASEAELQASTPSTPTNSDDVGQVKTETKGSSRTTSPAVIALSVFGGVAAVVLVALAAYVEKKKREDKHDDRVDGSSFDISHDVSTAVHGLSSSNAIVSAQSSVPNGSFCQVETPGTARVDVNFAVL